jgi:hypothetical protein
MKIYVSAVDTLTPPVVSTPLLEYRPAYHRARRARSLEHLHTLNKNGGKSLGREGERGGREREREKRKREKKKGGVAASEMKPDPEVV